MKRNPVLFGVAALPVAIALAAGPDARQGSDTDASIAALESSLGDARGLEIDEVRITGDGVACIEYRLRDANGKQARGHAVVTGRDVLRSPPPGGNASDDETFEKAWNEHCLGPRGGFSSER